MTLQNLQWLILGVNSIRPQSAQIFGQTLFWVVSVRVFLPETNLSRHKLGKADSPPLRGWASSNQLKARIEHKCGPFLSIKNSPFLMTLNGAQALCCLWTSTETLAIPGSSGC